MAERVGFKALNAEPCNGLYGLIQVLETEQLCRFQSPLDLIDLVRELIRPENVAQQSKM